MFIQNNPVTKNETKLLFYKPGHLLPILTAHELLQARHHQHIIRKLKEQTGVSDDYIETLYIRLIENFAEFVQVLPVHFQGPLFGLLNLGMLRASKGLQNYLEAGYEPDTLYNYAVFSAALLFDVSRIFIQYKIVFSDAQGSYLNTWNHFEGSMIGKTEFYKIYPLSTSYQRLQESLTILLARQLLPELGFQWLASDPHVFADWLDALRGDDRQGGRVSLELSKVRREDFNLETLQQMHVELHEPQATQHAEAFLNWLKNAIANESIDINGPNSLIHHVNEGIFIERKLFKQFADIYNAPVNMNVIFTQFENLIGVAKTGGDDYSFDQYFAGAARRESFVGILNNPAVNKQKNFNNAAANNSAVNKQKNFNNSVANKQKALREGIVVSDPNFIFVNGKIPPVSNLLKAVDSSSPHHKIPAAQKNQNSPQNTSNH